MIQESEIDNQMPRDQAGLLFHLEADSWTTWGLGHFNVAGFFRGGEDEEVGDAQRTSHTDKILDCVPCRFPKA